MSVDDRLRDAMTDVPPADPSGAYERIVEKKVRRGIVHRVQRVALGVVVAAGTAGGVAALARVFPQTRTPAASETSTVIGFEVFDGTRTELKTVDPTTGSVRTIATVDGIVAGWDWSPDGSKVVYAERRRGLFVLNVDGTSLRHLGTPAQALSPDWGPDGLIAYTVDWESPRDDAIYAVDVETQTVQPLYQAPDLGTVDWSPDGRRLAFVGPGPAGHAQGWDIYTMNADGSDVVNLTNHPAVDLDPAWSPDGSTILFRSRRAMPEEPITSEDRWNERLYTIHPDGTHLVELTRDTTITQSPTWSPDGTQIAFDDGKGIFVANADGANIRPLVDEGFAPVWQPVIGQTATETPPDTVTIAPTPTETPQPGEDIGLAFRLCNVETLKHVDFLGDGTDGTAWTGAPVTDAGRCTKEIEDTYVVAVDVTGDGLADDAWRGLEWCVDCQPYAATDLDSDGDQELIVLEQYSSTPQLGFFDVRPVDGTPRVRPIVVAGQGYAPGGLRAGEPLTVWTGGDEGFTGTIVCRGYPNATQILIGWADGPVEGPGSDMREVHIIGLRIADGVAEIGDASSFSQPTGEPYPYPFGADSRSCGIDWSPF